MADAIEDWFEQVDEAIVNLTNSIIRVQPQEEYAKIMNSIRAVQGKVDCARAAIQAERQMVLGSLSEINSSLVKNNATLRLLDRSLRARADTIVADKGTSPPEEET